MTSYFRAKIRDSKNGGTYFWARGKMHSFVSFSHTHMHVYVQKFFNTENAVWMKDDVDNRPKNVDLCMNESSSSSFSSYSYPCRLKKRNFLHAKSCTGSFDVRSFSDRSCLTLNPRKTAVKKTPVKRGVHVRVCVCILPTCEWMNKCCRNQSPVGERSHRCGHRKRLLQQQRV